MNILKKVVTGSAALLLTVAASMSFAIPTISVTPNPVSGMVGDSIFVDLFFDADGTRYLAGWDLNLDFDDAILDFVGVTFNPDGGLGTTVSGSTDFGTSVDLFDLSLTASVPLRALQDALGNMFVLATLEFLAVGAGDSALTLTGNSFTTPSGTVVSPGLENGLASVSAVPVPAPGVLSLLGLGLLSLALVGRPRRNA